MKRIKADAGADMSHIEGLIAGLVAKAVAEVVNQNGRFGEPTARNKPQNAGAGTRKAAQSLKSFAPKERVDKQAKAQLRRKAKAGDVEAVIARVKAAGFNPKANLGGCFQDKTGRWHERGGRFMREARKERLGLVDGVSSEETRAA